LDTAKRRTAADVLAMEGETSATMLAAMVRTVSLFDNRWDSRLMDDRGRAKNLAVQGFPVERVPRGSTRH
jgi:hypothetical protein